MNFQYYLKQKEANLKAILKRASYWIEYLFWFIFSISKFKRYPEDVKKILIICTGALGDAFCAFRTAYNISLENKEKEVCLYLSQDYSSDFKKMFKISNLRFISEREISSNRFDITLLFNLDKGLFKYRKNFGFCVGNEYSSIKESILSLRDILILNRKMPPFQKHKMRQEREIAEIAGLSFPEKLSPLKKSSSKKIPKWKKLEKYIVIHPSGRNFSKIFGVGKNPSLAWPLERFSKISDFIIENYGLNVALTGTKDERFIAEKVLKKVKNGKKIFNLSGKISIAELCEVIANSKLLISIDTSSVHIAELYDTPIVALFGPTFFEEVGPYGNPEKQITLAHPEKCIRDRKKGSSYDAGNICMNSISIEEVKNAINKIIKN